MNRIKFLSIKAAINLYKEMMKKYSNHIGGIQSEALLESAMMEPRASFGKQYLYENLFEMAAAYTYHIIKNHPFIDGNKRAGILIGITFLNLNGIEINASDNKLYQLTIDIASSKKNKKQISRFLKKHSNAQ